jgi:predicted Co/Zn/Cd cation transporter (cation efflux family)
MKKVHVQTTVLVMVPVKVEVDLFLKADDDANIETAVKRWAKGQDFSKADVESADVERVTQIGAIKDVPENGFRESVRFFDTVTGAIEEIVEGTGNKKLLDMRVTDSR